MNENNYNFNGQENNGGQQYAGQNYVNRGYAGGQNYAEQSFTTAPKPPRKKGKVGTVIALVAAVALAGGASGFGGAYLAGMAARPAVQSGGQEAPAAGGASSKPAEKPVDIPADVASAISNIYSGSGISEELKSKTPADKVVPTGPNGEYTATELYEAVNDTIVLVNIYKKTSGSAMSYYDYFFGYGDINDARESEPVFAGYGSGIVFTEDGYILTNAHITEGAAKLEVVVNDYEDSGKTHTYEAKLIGEDTDTDVAIIKIDRDEPFRTAAIGDSDTLKVGQDVCAIGNPGVNEEVMFPHTMTKGIVTGLNRVSLSTGYTTSSIQIDAAINGGNSGGALFDMYGNVVGVVNKKIVVSNIENLGFAITINEAKPVMEDLLTYGKVTNRPVLGIVTAELNEYRAELYKTKLSRGLLVTSINENAAASKSKLRLNDIITKINGTNVETVKDVQGIIKNMKAGDTITATVAREKEDGTVESLEIEIELSSKSVND